MEYVIDVDITMSKRIYIEASNEEEARTIASRAIDASPYDYAGHADAYVKHEIVDIYEDL